MKVSNWTIEVVIWLDAQYFQIMPNFEDFQQLKSWKRQGASNQTKFYKSNKERIFLATLPSTSVNFENQKLQKKLILHIENSWRAIKAYNTEKLSKKFGR